MSKTSTQGCLGKGCTSSVMLAPKIEILLVDDDSCVTKIVQAVFPDRNYWITGVRDPHQALMLCDERVFDLILLDIGLPDMDGYEVLERLQQNPATRSVPVIMLTGSDSIRDKARALEAGAIDYITKPFEIPELRSRIRAAVRTKILQDQLILAQKMESIGQLAAGIAHEINTPIQFVGDNLNFLKDSFESLEKLLKVLLVKHDCSEKQEENGRLIPLGKQAGSASNLEEFNYLSEEIPKAIHESLEGIHRITDIVRAIGDFPHPSSKGPVPSDLNRAIKSTINVARNEWKSVADLKLNLDPDLPIIPCFIGELNQAILNLIVNAAQSIAEKGGHNSVNPHSGKLRRNKCQ